MRGLLKVLSVAMGIFLLGSVLSGLAWAAAAKEGEFTAKLGHTLNPTDPRHRGVEYLAKLVAERSQNRIKINIFPSSQLGPERELIKGLQSGAIEMTSQATTHLMNFVPEMGVFDLPYLVSKPEELAKVLDGPVGAELLGKLPPKGIIAPGYWEASFRHVYTRTRPVNTMADLKGLKIRVPGNPVYTATLKAMGASPTPMPLGELYTAMQQGTVDGAENIFSFIYESKHYEIAKNLALTYHAILPAVTMISKKFYDDLPPDLQKILYEATKEAGLYERKLEADEGIAALDKMKAAGLKVTTPDLAPFVSATRKVYPEFEGTLGKDLIQKMLDALKK
jgi:TRAP-type transport system periplasmic protein